MLGQQQRANPSEVTAVDWERLLGQVKLREKPSITDVRSGWGQSVPGHIELSRTVLTTPQEFPVAQLPRETILVDYQTPHRGSKDYAVNTQSTTFRQPNRRSEGEWAVAHPEILKPYAGKWVVIERDRIISDDVDPSDAVEKARRAGVVRPFLLHVHPQDDAIIF